MEPTSLCSQVWIGPSPNNKQPLKYMLQKKKILNIFCTYCKFYFSSTFAIERKTVWHFFFFFFNNSFLIRGVTLEAWQNFRFHFSAKTLSIGWVELCINFSCSFICWCQFWAAIFLEGLFNFISHKISIPWLNYKQYFLSPEVNGWWQLIKYWNFPLSKIWVHFCAEWIYLCCLWFVKVTSLSSWYPALSLWWWSVKFRVTHISWEWIP